LWHAGATLAYSARITFPSSGVWVIAPFGGSVTVRALDPFEPPLVHVHRWSDPFDPGCGRREVAALVSGFVDAYNAGDTARLVTFVQPAIDFTIGGGAAALKATNRTSLATAAAERHTAGERIVVERIEVASNKGMPQMAIYGRRFANDLPPNGQHVTSKAAMYCGDSQFIHWNIDAR
jgi:hypothetical protein